MPSAHPNIPTDPTAIVAKKAATEGLSSSLISSRFPGSHSASARSAPTRLTENKRLVRGLKFVSHPNTLAGELYVCEAAAVRFCRHQFTHYGNHPDVTLICDATLGTFLPNLLAITCMFYPLTLRISTTSELSIRYPQEYSSLDKLAVEVQHIAMHRGFWRFRQSSASEQNGLPCQVTSS